MASRDRMKGMRGGGYWVLGFEVVVREGNTRDIFFAPRYDVVLSGATRRKGRPSHDEKTPLLLSHGSRTEAGQHDEIGKNWNSPRQRGQAKTNC